MPYICNPVCFPISFAVDMCNVNRIEVSHKKLYVFDDGWICHGALHIFLIVFMTKRLSPSMWMLSNPSWVACCKPFVKCHCFGYENWCLSKVVSCGLKCFLSGLWKWILLPCLGIWRSSRIVWWNLVAEGATRWGWRNEWGDGKGVVLPLGEIQ